MASTTKQLAVSAVLAVGAGLIFIFVSLSNMNSLCAGVGHELALGAFSEKPGGLAQAQGLHGLSASSGKLDTRQGFMEKPRNGSQTLEFPAMPRLTKAAVDRCYQWNARMRAKLACDRIFEQSQKFEEKWHRTVDNFRRHDEVFIEQSAFILGDVFGFERDQGGGIVIDIGAGSRARGLEFLRNTRLVLIEPLAQAWIDGHYNQPGGTLSYVNLQHAYSVSSIPGEIVECQFTHAAKHVFSINAIDHASDADAIFRNFGEYLGCSGIGAMIVDMHKPEAGHPLELTQTMIEESFERHGMVVLQDAEHLKARQTLRARFKNFGHGEASLVHVRLSDATRQKLLEQGECRDI